MTARAIVKGDVCKPVAGPFTHNGTIYGVVICISAEPFVVAATDGLEVWRDKSPADFRAVARANRKVLSICRAGLRKRERESAKRRRK